MVRKASWKIWAWLERLEDSARWEKNFFTRAKLIWDLHGRTV